MKKKKKAIHINDVELIKFVQRAPARAHSTSVGHSGVRLRYPKGSIEPIVEIAISTEKTQLQNRNKALTLLGISLNVEIETNEENDEA